MKIDLSICSVCMHLKKQTYRDGEFHYFCGKARNMHLAYGQNNVAIIDGNVPPACDFMLEYIILRDQHKQP